ncbi:MAG: efflux RND transporter permease subunit, partial [Treponemataceae bacterium]|nr:efflux RND transporter permease subunit [Treponemataceae bacterium]
MSISKMAVNRPTTILIIFILATALGIYCTTSLPLNLTPEMEIPYIVVSTSYTNAGPEEVEKSVSRILESALSSVTGLKKMTSTSQSGASLVLMELEYGTNLDAATNDIRDKIDLVRNYLPDTAGSPIIFRMDPSMIPIMGLVVTGPRTPEELSGFAENIIQPRLEQIDGVASANISGGREKAVIVDVPRDRLDAYELTITQIAQMIAAQNISSSGGVITSGDANYSIKAEGTYSSIEDIKQSVVSYKVKQNGTRTPDMVSILLRDIADVYEGYKDVSSMAYLDGTPCVVLQIQKQSGKNSLATAKKVRSQLKKIQAELPSDVEIIESFNTTDNIGATVRQVVTSLLEGIVLAVIVLYIFLRSFRSTFIIALAIPISVLITLALMYFCGFSINMMTLSGLLLGIGMLVDNSIVILENIFSYREKDAKPAVAAVLGSEEMLGSITSSTLTSVCIFLPMIMFNKKLGMIGRLFEDFAFTIVFSLLCSLLVAAVLVPVLSSKYLVIGKSSTVKKNKVARGFDRAMSVFFHKLDNAYAKAVTWVLKHKAITLGTIAGLFVLSVASIGIIGFTFMPSTVDDTL